MSARSQHRAGTCIAARISSTWSDLREKFHALESTNQVLEVIRRSQLHMHRKIGLADQRRLKERKHFERWQSATDSHRPWRAQTQCLCEESFHPPSVPSTPGSDKSGSSRIATDPYLSSSTRSSILLMRCFAGPLRRFLCSMRAWWKGRDSRSRRLRSSVYFRDISIIRVLAARSGWRSCIAAMLRKRKRELKTLG